MPLYLSLPLPGPFRYTRRVGGRKSGPPDPQAGAILLAIVLLGVAVWALGWWLVPVLIVVLGLPLAGWLNRRRRG